MLVALTAPATTAVIVLVVVVVVWVCGSGDRVLGGKITVVMVAFCRLAIVCSCFTVCSGCIVCCQRVSVLSAGVAFCGCLCAGERALFADMFKIVKKNKIKERNVI